MAESNGGGLDFSLCNQSGSVAASRILFTWQTGDGDARELRAANGAIEMWI